MLARQLPAVFGWHNFSAGAGLSTALVNAEAPHASVSISLSNYGLRDVAFVFHSLTAGRCSFTGLATQHIQPATASIVRRKEVKKEKGTELVYWGNVDKMLQKIVEAGNEGPENRILKCETLLSCTVQTRTFLTFCRLQQSGKSYPEFLAPTN